MVRLAIWFGVVAGLAEVAALLIRDAVDPYVGPEVIRVNRHWLWMVQVADLALFALSGLPLAALAWWRGPWARRLGMFWFCFVLSLLPLLPLRRLYLMVIVVLACGVALRMSRWLGARADRFDRLVRRSWPALLGGAIGLGGLAYHRVETAEVRALAALPPAAPSAPNVLFVVWDTVRADALSLYGYQRDTTPNLRELARRGVRFDQARSTAPWTLPSHGSLFTGRWPHELGAGINRGIDPSHPTLAEWLAARGYVTGGFVGNTHFCNDRFGIAKGFQHYEDHREKRVVSALEIFRNCGLGRRITTDLRRAGIILPGMVGPRKQAPEVNGDFLAWLEEVADEKRPFFAFVNYIDAHDPYVLPEGLDWPRFGLTPETPEDHQIFHEWLTSPKQHFTDRQLTLARDGYDDCIRYIDAHFQKLLDELEQRGALENTLVIVTADHGESFGEHQIFGHARSLYRPELHVPLVIVGPPGGRVPSGQVVDQPVSLRDVAATVVDLLGSPGGSPFPGRSLARAWTAPTDSGASAAEPILSEVSIPRDGEVMGRAPALLGPMHALLIEGNQYIRNANGIEELYDVWADPAESRNLTAHPNSRTVLKTFRQVLEHYRSR
jgi:arylsulfatase A-like enzyme